jgi:hypothetical protein
VPIGHDHVLLLPTEAGSVARFNAESHHTEVYCDLTTVPVWQTEDEVTMIDLDLDFCWMRRDGSIHLLDEEGFAVHRLGYGYPDDLLMHAARTAAWLRTVRGDGTEPFARGYPSVAGEGAVNRRIM